MNLLVRTNCADLDVLMKRNFEVEYDKAELNRLRGIEKYNADKVDEIRQQFVAVLHNLQV